MSLSQFQRAGLAVEEACSLQLLCARQFPVCSFDFQIMPLEPQTNGPFTESFSFISTSRAVVGVQLVKTVSAWRGWVASAAK